MIIRAAMNSLLPKPIRFTHEGSPEGDEKRIFSLLEATLPTQTFEQLNKLFHKYFASVADKEPSLQLPLSALPQATPKFMSIAKAQHKIYILQGSTGEYDEAIRWFIAAYLSKDDCERHRVLCRKDAAIWERLRDSPYDSPDRGWSLYDPALKMDSNGTVYTITELPINTELP